MTAIHLHLTSDVGTTYKRALQETFLFGTTPSRDVPASEKHWRWFCFILYALMIERTAMRKPRDFDAELKALTDEARTLKERKVRQLGELVAATGADALDVETLAGGLLAMIEADDSARKESWHKRDQAFFQRRTRDAARGNGSGDSGA